jgi:protein involved in polysaccharide export with SLBB domain
MKIKALILVCLLGIVLYYPLLTQTKGFSLFENDKILQDEYLSKMSGDKLLGGDKFTPGDVVNPDFYFVGPGDVLALQNLTASINVEYLTISPEISIIIPRIGQFSLKGMTLTEVRKILINAVKEKNSLAIVAVSLNQPRTVIVTLSGNVISPGTYSIPASFKVSTAIRMLNQLNTQRMSVMDQQNLSTTNLRKQYVEKYFSQNNSSQISQYAQRNIYVIHSDGSSTLADIEESKISSIYALDPYVREGDNIIIPKDPLDYPKITITGAVIRPTTLPYKKSDNISKLLKFGFALTQDADPDNIYLNNANNERLKLEIDSAMNLQGENIQIKPGASVTVGFLNAKSSKAGSVIINGKVVNPGSYTIISGQSRIKEVIEKCGGFTDEAYLPLAYIIRKEKNFISAAYPSWNVAETFQYTDLKLEDTTRFNLDIYFKKPIVSCDFEQLFEKNIEKENVVLQDGDLIIIPDNPNTVYVYGQIHKPGYVTYQKNKTMEWYIEQAGGYAINAEKSRARIIEGRSKVWKKGSDDIYVRAGDEIYIPKPPDNPPGLEIQTYAMVASVLASVALLINIFYSIFSAKK